MDLIAQFIEQAKQRDSSVVLPEAHDPRIVRAARWLQDNDVARPILLGKLDRIKAAARQADVSLEAIEWIDPAESDRLEGFVEQYRKRRPVTVGIGMRVVRKPLLFAGMMVAGGDATTMVAGVANATATVIQAGVLTVGHAAGIETISSFFLMLMPSFDGQQDVPFIFADCAVNIEPSAEQLADIALAAHASAARLLGDTPRVAMLSFSTCGSAMHAAVEKTQKALALTQQKDPAVIIDGEFQLDTALISTVARRKVKRQSEVAGRANVLIFPDLSSGNIAYKLTQHLAGARAIGPILQGFAKPISDLSRVATVDDIVASVAICLASG